MIFDALHQRSLLRFVEPGGKFCAAAAPARQPLRAQQSRRIGRDEDMAGAAIYLASRAGDYVVGTTLVVDGGVSCVIGH